MALTDIERDICDRIASKRQEMVDELAAWVAIPTGRGFRPGLHRQRAKLAARLRALGAVTSDHPCEARPQWLMPDEDDQAEAHTDQATEHPPVDTLVGAHAGEGPRILLSGHFDTVHDPHGAFRELRDIGDGKASGPGAADMKGGLVAAFAALAALAAAGRSIRWSFVLTPDEETGSFGSAAALRKLAATHDCGFVLEPAGPGGSLITERMGAGQFRIETFGRAAHVGRDYEQGISAVRILCERVLAAEALAAPAEGRIVNVGPLQGGPVTNAVPDHAVAWGNVRFGTPQAEAALAQALDALNHGADGAVPRVRVQRTFNRPAKPATPAVERLASLARATSQDLGHQLPFAKTGGVCDGNTLQGAGLAVIDTLGVRGGNLHRQDEFIELDSLVDRAQLIALMLLRTAAGAAPTMRA